jgi:transcriptional regulator with XRE-family HTH domain
MKTIDIVASGQNIKQLVTQHNFNISDIQEALGFNTPQAIYKWYRGESMPTIDNLILLSELFNCSIDDIVVIKEI